MYDTEPTASMYLDTADVLAFANPRLRWNMLQNLQWICVNSIAKKGSKRS